MGGPGFAGSSQVTRTLSVEPGTPLTIGALGAVGVLRTGPIRSMDTDWAATLLSFLCPSFTFTVTEYSCFSPRS